MLTIYSYLRIYASMNVDPTLMARAAETASELLKSLGNPTRLLILCRLTEAECSVGDLVAFLGIRDSTVSQHLALLRKDGLVRTRREGQTIWYAIASEPARRLLETLFAIYCCPNQGLSPSDPH
jgi:DNA-binding transcriptional ArsR family regulator